MAGSWLFFWLSLLLLVTPSEFSDVVGHEPVQATAGDDVILSYHLDPPFDVSNLAVEWKRNGHTVHLYRHMADNYDDQDEHFRGRTSMFHSELVKGNISLKLTNVNKDDSGLYIWYIPRLNSQVKRGNVFLIVNSQKDPGVGEPSKDVWTGLIIGVVVIIAVSAVIIIVYYIKHGRRERNNQDGYKQTQQDPQRPLSLGA